MGSKHNRNKFTKNKLKLNTTVQQADFKETNKNIYYKYYKQLLIIPMLMLVVALILLFVQYNQTGDFLNKGISLKGGTSFTISNTDGNLLDLNINQIENNLKNKFPELDISIRELKDFATRKAIVIEVDILASEIEQLDLFQEEILNEIPSLTKQELQGNVQSTGSELGDSFYKQILKALILAFIFMGIVVFIQFKVIIPSLAVMLSAFSDIIVTLAIINLLGVKIGTAGIAAFLMLIGYSVDTDILMSSRVLKNKNGTVYSRIVSSMKTGFLMNITTLLAVSIGLILTNSDIIFQIMLIVFVGLLVDMINTWIQNAAILRWYAEKVEK